MRFRCWIAVLIVLLLLPWPSAEATVRADASAPVLTTGEALNLLRTSAGLPETTYADRLADWSALPPGGDRIAADAENAEPDDTGYLASGLSRPTEPGEDAVYRVEIASGGRYFLSIDYLTVDRNLTANTVSLQVDGAPPFDEAESLELPSLWRDETKDFLPDRYGNETIPRTLAVNRWRTLSLRLPQDPSPDPLALYLAEGAHEIRFRNAANRLVFGRLALEGAAVLPDYDDYRAGLGGQPLGTGVLTLSAVDYSEKNSSYINATAIPNPDLEPFREGMRRLNALDEEGFSFPGQEVSFRVRVPATARYRLSVQYATSKEDAPVYRSLLVDGRIPFREAGTIAFEPTRGAFRTLPFDDADGTPYEILLEEGERTLTLRVTAGPAAAAARSLSACLDHIAWFSQQIRRITGKEVDPNRTWRLTTYFPDTGRYLEAYAVLMQDAFDGLSAQWPGGRQSAGLSDLGQALKKLRSLSEKPDELPLRLDALQAGGGAVAELLGTQNERLLDQPMALNALYLHGAEGPPPTRKSLFLHLRERIRDFLSTFTRNVAGVANREEGRLSVWVNRPVQQVDLIQKLTDARFAADTGNATAVDFSHLANEGRLILAKASGTSPDLVIGLSGWIPYELSIRGAGYDLARFPDFWAFASRFPPGAFVPLVIGDGVYAIPEGLDFQALFYRKDILDSIGLQVPDTWDDVLEMLPELQRNGLAFYHQMAVNSAYKWFNVTYVDIAQFGCRLYSEDGTRLNLSSPEGLAALDFQTRLFTTYSMPEQVASFYQSFRRGTIPIGIGNFYTYVQLKAAAPEIAGRWGIAPLPGQIDADGEVVRWTPGLSTTAFLFEDARDPDTAWTFMKWWLSADIQSEFGYRLQSIFGPTYMWLPANLEAVETMPVETADRAVIREQLTWIAEPVKTPATYMVERGLSDIWNSVVFDGVSVRVAVDRMQIEADRELRRKLEEFGYIRDGVVVRPYRLPTVEGIEAKMVRHGD